MRQEVQFVVGQPQSRPTTDVGKFPVAETGDFSLHADSDPAEKNDALHASASHGGVGETAGECPSDTAGNCGFAARCMIALIRVYQRTLSRLLPDQCRFRPSCSCYAVEAFAIHGFFRGFWLTCYRLLRCQPFCQGGYDPVPPRKSKGKSVSRK